MSTNSLRFRAAVAVALSLAGLTALLAGGCAKKSSPNSVSSALPSAPVVSPEPASHVLSPEGRARFDEAIRVQNLYTPDLLTKPGVIGTGTGVAPDGTPAILVLTREAGVRAPASIGGVPLITRFVGRVVAYAKPGGGTLQMGTSTGNDRECSAGTLGCVVIKGGSSYFLSNNHVFARENAAAIGERIDAPGRYDAHPKCAQTPICGTLADFQPISFSSNNTIDAAITLRDPSRSFTCTEAAGYTPSSTVVAPSLGLAVKKDGRTSGLTHSTIQGINVTIQVQYSSGVATFVNQIMTSAQFIRSGDSGSLMVTETGNNPVGLCFAGGSGGAFANPIGPVLSRFSATVCSTP